MEIAAGQEKAKRWINCLLPNVALKNVATRKSWLKNPLAALPAGLKILDARAGELQYKPWCTHLDYVSQDFNQYDGKGDESDLQTSEFDTSRIDLVLNITAIPITDESFDVVMCIEVLEHVPDPNRAVQELTRVPRKVGILIITTPFCSITHFSPYHFTTGFNGYFYQQVLGEHYNILEVTANGNFYEYLAQEIVRVPMVAHTYSKFRVSPIEMGWLILALRVLNRLNRHANASSDILCFGYHFRCIKK
ncbi:class I SAM-dependent methyltransferase [Spirosoma spitsbergense]|uniref:class I SAM-dependent methyltransferase n=1 Tax=Spirosoma spitsbergense TaxID=431554 RepID=UPI0003709F92|nr:class I SAM-dependent methyltransferase [Spirosoma spitsbergense]